MIDGGAGVTGATGPSGGTAISHGPPSHFAPPPLSISLDPVTGLALFCLFVGVVIAPKLQIAHLRLIQ
jgi:hypothetical protein